MKTTLMTLILGSSAALVLTGCWDDKQKVNGTADGVLIEMEFPPEIIEGTPKPVKVPNLRKAPSQAPLFRVPEGTTLLSAGKKVTSSDDFPLIGELDLVTDGEKEGGQGYFVELSGGTQWIQIDLEESHPLHALWIWHFHANERAYHDVVIQVSDDPGFKSGVTTVFNNDYDQSSGLGKGRDRPYVESRFGHVIDADGVVARYVRLYSRQNTYDEMNHYIEVEVYGKPGS